MGIRLDANMRLVLEAFDRCDGYATTGYLVDETGKSRPTVTKRLDQLRAGDHIEYVHAPTAFWRLVEDPRDLDEGETLGGYRDGDRNVE